MDNLVVTPEQATEFTEWAGVDRREASVAEWRRMNGDCGTVFRAAVSCRCYPRYLLNAEFCAGDDLRFRQPYSIGQVESMTSFRRERSPFGNTTATHGSFLAFTLPCQMMTRSVPR
jgi:hypothetical protein